MARSLIPPGKYIRRAGAISEIGELAARLGACVFTPGAGPAAVWTADALGVGYKKRNMNC